MRLNKYVAASTGVSRRSADELIKAGRVMVNGQIAIIGRQIKETDVVTMNAKVLLPAKHIYLALNKPVGYVSSRRGQGAKTIQELLPEPYRHLKTVGRLDKASSGLILLTNDGDFALRMTHPSFAKTKVYDVTLNQPLKEEDAARIKQGIQLEDGFSQFQLTLLEPNRRRWQIEMREGRNRQIRRTFLALRYRVLGLHRTAIGSYHLGELQSGKYKEVNK